MKKTVARHRDYVSVFDCNCRKWIERVPCIVKHPNYRLNILYWYLLCAHAVTSHWPMSFQFWMRKKRLCCVGGDVGIAIEIQLNRQPCQCMVARSSVWRDAPRQAAKLSSEAYGVHEQIPRYYTKWHDATAKCFDQIQKEKSSAKRHTKW